MKKFAIVYMIALASLLALGSAAANNWTHNSNHRGNGTRGSGDQVTQERKVDAFTRIESSLAIEMVVEVGKPQSVNLTFDDNLIDFIRTEVDGKTLIIDTDESFSSENGVRIKITVPTLDMVNSAGSGEIEVHNIDGKKFRAILSGSGNIILDGKAVLIDIEINGSGDVDAENLDAQDASVTINGSGAASVAATGSLDAEVNGSGNILYVGKPESIYTSVNGSGKIKKLR